MKRRDTDHFRGGFLRVIDAFAKKRGISISDSSMQETLLEELSKEIEESRSNPIRLHGFRIQSMFAYVAAALGSCKIISEEDSGLFFHDEKSEMGRPDLRISTVNDERFFVEVKNRHGKSLDRPFSVKEDYFSKMSSYAEAMSIPLKFAIYWSSWNIWTLVDSRQLKSIAGKRSLSFIDAIKADEMSLLGDARIATIPPLEVHFHFVRNDEASPAKDGFVNVTINDVSIHAGGKRISDSEELQLAWFFCRYSRWTKQDAVIEFKGEKEIVQKLSFAPEVPIPGQEFDVLGTMSQMISQQYSEDTSKDRVVSSISPTRDVSQFGVIIPPEYKGKDLPIWRLILKPIFRSDSENDKERKLN